MAFVRLHFARAEHRGSRWRCTGPCLARWVETGPTRRPPTSRRESPAPATPRRSGAVGTWGREVAGVLRRTRPIHTHGAVQQHPVRTHRDPNVAWHAQVLDADEHSSRVMAGKFHLPAPPPPPRCSSQRGRWAPTRARTSIDPWWCTPTTPVSCAASHCARRPPPRPGRPWPGRQTNDLTGRPRCRCTCPRMRARPNGPAASGRPSRGRTGCLGCRPSRGPCGR